MNKKIGYIVSEVCEDWEQGLCLVSPPGCPEGGLLMWREEGKAITIFPTFAEAREAVTRTEHYRLAYITSQLPENQFPEKRFCKIIPVSNI